MDPYYKNSRMLEEIRGEDNAINMFLRKYRLLFLDYFPKCTLGHLRSVLTELDIIRLDEWQHFLKLIWEFMEESANHFSFCDRMEEVIPEKMHNCIQGILFRHYRDKITKKTYCQLLTEIYGHPFSNYKHLVGTPYR